MIFCLFNSESLPDFSKKEVFKPEGVWQFPKDPITSIHELIAISMNHRCRRALLRASMLVMKAHLDAGSRALLLYLLTLLRFRQTSF